MKTHHLAILLTALALTTPLPADQAPSLRQKRSDLFCSTHRAICYSGFRAGQHPDRGNGAKNPSRQQILADLKIIKNDAKFDVIRLYDAKENSATVLELIREHKLDLKVLLGAWLDAEVNNPLCPWKPKPFTPEELAENKKKNQAELKAAISLARRYPATVRAVAVGNEALVEWNDHMVPVETIITYVRQMKDAIDQDVTVADNYDWWAKHGQELAKEVDFVSVHIYPVWEDRPISQGLSYSIENMQKVRQALPDSRLVITEAGWATTASEFGDRASEKHQARYFQEIFAWAKDNHITTFFFEAFDEDWKGDPNNPQGAEKHWGLYFIDRTPKQVMQPEPRR